MIKRQQYNLYYAFLAHNIITCNDTHRLVMVGNTVSGKVSLNIGVPQDSILGPLLFLVYVLPLQRLLRRLNVSWHSYADDLQIYRQFSIKTSSVRNSKL